MMKFFNMKKKRLKQVIEEINKKIVIAENNFKRQQNTRIGFSEGKRGTQFTRQSLMSLYATEANELKSTVNNPYFGKFEFRQQDGEIKKYILVRKKLHLQIISLLLMIGIVLYAQFIMIMV